MEVYGYARISRPTQHVDRQVRNIKEVYPEATVIQETYTGRNMDRPAWTRLLRTVHAGDTIVFDSVSRMSRNADEGFQVYQELYEKGISLVFLKEPYISTATYEKALEDQFSMTGSDKIDPILKGVNEVLRNLKKEHIRLAFEQSEKEVEDLRQRTREGIKNARLNGKQIGQQPGRKLNVKKQNKALEIIRKYSKSFGGPLPDAECMTLCGVSRKTFYQYKKMVKQETKTAEN